MKSNEILNECVDAKGLKEMASTLGVSSSVVEKWCEDAKEYSDNPLQRILTICIVTKDRAPLDWLCAQLNSIRANQPGARVEPLTVLMKTQRILKEFANVLDAVTQSSKNDDRIDPTETELIRHEWNQLKSVAESFVLACEAGQYNLKPET